MSTTPLSAITRRADQPSREAPPRRTAMRRRPRTRPGCCPAPVASPAPTICDGVVPRDQVGGEEQAGDDRQPPLRRRPRPEAALLGAGQEPQHRQGVEAPEDRGVAGSTLASRTFTPVNEMASAPRTAARMGREPSRSRGGASSLLIGALRYPFCLAVTQARPETTDPMPSLPTGTVTFLFTDIEGSTRLLESLGDGSTSPRAAPRPAARRPMAGDGTEVGTEGDAFFAVFPSAPRAVAAASTRQRASPQSLAEDASVRVRMGLHTGEGTLGGDDYVGLDVHRAPGSPLPATGGQVLLSGATRALAAGGLPPGIGAARPRASTGSRTSRGRSASCSCPSRACPPTSRRCARWTPRPTTCRSS